MIGIGTVGKQKYELPYLVLSSKNKNKLLKDLINKGCDKLFLIQDGLKIKDNLVFEHFAIASDKTGLECMSLCGAELSNKKPIYTHDPYINYWQFPGTIFAFYTANAAQKAGFMDEKFPADTWEDVEFMNRIADLGLTSPFGMFVGIKNEERYFELDVEELNKRVEKDKSRNETFKEATLYWQNKNPEKFPDIGMPTEKKFELKKAGGEMI
jgi:hypothetical protein